MKNEKKYTNTGKCNDLKPRVFLHFYFFIGKNKQILEVCKKDFEKENRESMNHK